MHSVSHYHTAAPARLARRAAGVRGVTGAAVAAAAAAGCAIEINCNPERLDLDWRLCRQAVDAGALLSSDPDAHSVA